MFVELGICLAAGLIGSYLTNTVSGLNRAEAEQLLATNHVGKLKRREARRLREEEDRKREAEDAARAEVERYLDAKMIAFRLRPEPLRLTADTFLTDLPADVQQAVQAEIEAGTAERMETRAYLALVHRRGGGRNDA